MRHSVYAETVPEKGISLDDEGRLVEELRNLKSQRSSRQMRAEKAVQVLHQTNSARVRNAAALALADLRARDAKDALINLLKRPDTKGSRGTILYALEQLRENIPLSILVDIMVDDSYEAREEALIFITRDSFECSAEDFVRAQAKLEIAWVSADGDQAHAIRKALEYLRIKHY